MTKIPNSEDGEQRVAIVTGGSRGLGREIALRFGRAGWNVVVNYVRSADAAEEVAAQVRSFGAGAAATQADVAEPAACEKLVGTAIGLWGRLDGLVNNAAIARDRPIVRLPEGDWDAVIATDLLAPMRLARRAAGAMPAGSSVVNVVSLCGLWGCAGASAYSAAKAALSGFTSGAAAEFARQGIRINAVAPGCMPTDMGRSAPGVMEAARAQHAMHVLADPRGAAEFVFALGAMPGVSGQVFVLDGRIR